jgi:LmbE family N-acetylglucosaminyl deacetylase
MVEDMKRNVLFVSVHPDDETLGCGGTILKHKALGDTINWLNITDISNDHPLSFDQEIVIKRQVTIEKVKESYSFNKCINLKFYTMLLDMVGISSLIKNISEGINEIQPDTLYIPNRGDVHSDHKIAFQAIYSCTKQFRYPYIKRVLMYETLSETEFAPALAENAFIPNTFVDITDYIDKKVEIMKLYETEIMLDPLPRSAHAIKGLAAFRGSRIGVQYAEAFQSLFEIW